MLHLALVIDIDGEMNQSTLQLLRDHLRLRKQGRLTDDWDQHFGTRRIVYSNGQHRNVDLWRQFDNSWTVDVLDTDDLDVGPEALDLLRDELIAGIKAAGFTATVRDQPTFGSKNPP